MENLLKLTTFFEQKSLKSFAAYQASNRYFLKKSLEDSGMIPQVSDEDFEGWKEENHSLIYPMLDYNWGVISTDYGYPTKGIGAVTNFSYHPQRHFIFKDNINGWRKFVEENYEEKELGLLKPYKNIPKLYFIRAEVSEESAPTSAPLSKTLSHNFFLFKAFKELFPIYFKPEDVENYILKNEEVINKIRRSFSTTPKHLGGGADGVAFDIGSDFVLKIFKDQYSYTAAKAAMERLHKNPEIASKEAMIYDVGQLPDYLDNNVYYYIIQKLETLPRSGSVNVLHFILLNIMDMINNQSEKLKPLKALVKENKELDKINSYVKFITKIIVQDLMKRHKDNIESIQNDLKLKDDWIFSYVEEILVKYLTGRLDLHLGNVGITPQRELRYFDPAYYRDASVFPF